LPVYIKEQKHISRRGAEAQRKNSQDFSQSRFDNNWKNGYLTGVLIEDVEVIGGLPARGPSEIL
jgi:hypothetical protein